MIKTNNDFGLISSGYFGTLQGANFSVQVSRGIARGKEEDEL